MNKHNAGGYSYTVRLGAPRALGPHSLTPPAPHQVKMNKFADLSSDEFRTVMGLRSMPESSAPDVSAERLESVLSAAPPPHVDWRLTGNVNPVKDQGQCGSCWAFSAVGASEVSISIKTGVLLDLSEQEVVSCDTKTDDGCDGGDMDTALDYIIKHGGLAATADYPYTSGTTGEDGKCLISDNVASISGYEKVRGGRPPPRRPIVAPASSLTSSQVTKKNETLMISFAAISALSVGIDASGLGFMLYDGGIFDDSKKECKPGQRDHGTVIVGYEAGTQVALDGFWIMRNSWSEECVPRLLSCASLSCPLTRPSLYSWGENGNMNVKMGVEGPEGVCGIAIEAILVDA